VLSRSDTPVDRLILINLDSFYRVSDHQGGFIAGTGEPALSVVLVFPKPGMHKGLLLGSLRKRTDVQVADVQAEVRRLFRLVGGIDKLLLLISWLVVIIGIVSITVAIYNTMAERRTEIATLRAIGAGRRFVFAMVLGEATMLAAAGGLFGILLGHGLILILGPYLNGVAGLSLHPWRLIAGELIVLGVVIGVGAIAGLLPAWRAYRTDVASSLSGTA
jgi:putative ABC transport system permease protein